MQTLEAAFCLQQRKGRGIAYPIKRTGDHLGKQSQEAFWCKSLLYYQSQGSNADLHQQMNIRHELKFCPDRLLQDLYG